MGQPAENLTPRFSITTSSRHPANQKGYDSPTHRYRADYVNPRFWILHLDARAGLLEDPDGMGKPLIPNDILSFQWAVKQVGGPFSRTVVKDRNSSAAWRVEVQVPAPGEYDITLQLNLTGGRRQVSSRRYRLRDFLIVSIGDSFAAGQGNPDIPAVPSPDEEALCEATTLKLTIPEAIEAINKFIRNFKEKAEEKLEDYLPYLGKVIVAGLGGVEDIAAFVKDGIGELGDALVEVGRKAEAVFVEGAEELLGKIGIGDGGESEEAEPHPARWQEPNAYRSYRAGHSLAARQIERETQYGADRITFLSFARSGSEIRHGLLGPRTENDVAIDAWIGNRGQVKEAADTLLNRPIDALIITVGVNDLGFSGSLKDMIKGSFFSDRDREQIVRDIEKKRTEQMPTDFEALKRAIDTQLHPRKVFIVEYPAGLFTKLDENNQVKNGGPCGVFSSSIGLDLDFDEGKTLRQLGRNLNSTLRDTADAFGWTFIAGIEAGFDGHGYCAGQPYFVSAEESCRNQSDFEGMVHPNKQGHDVARDCIAHALQRVFLTSEENWLEPVLNVMMS